jgi:hypothetical protein
MSPVLVLVTAALLPILVLGSSNDLRRVMMGRDAGPFVDLHLINEADAEVDAVLLQHDGYKKQYEKEYTGVWLGCVGFDSTQSAWLRQGKWIKMGSYSRGLAVGVYKSVEAFYEDGVLHGPYWSSGMPMASGQYVHGVKVGPWEDEEYLDDGRVLKCTGTYNTNGQRHGIWTVFGPMCGRQCIYGRGYCEPHPDCTERRRAEETKAEEVKMHYKRYSDGLVLRKGYTLSSFVDDDEGHSL